MIDRPGELSARRGERFADDTEAARNLVRDPRFPLDLVKELERTPRLRNVPIREYVALDPYRVVEALERLNPIDRFIAIVSEIERSQS